MTWMAGRVSELRRWADSRINACRQQEAKFGNAWELREKHQHGPPQALVEAWTERRCLEAVLRMLDESTGDGVERSEE